MDWWLKVQVKVSAAKIVYSKVSNLFCHPRRGSKALAKWRETSISLGVYATRPRGMTKKGGTFVAEQSNE